MNFGTEQSRQFNVLDTKTLDLYFGGTLNKGDHEFKFGADNKKAQVMLDIEMKDEEKRAHYFEKLEAFRAILEEEFINDLVFEKDLMLETGKTISRVWVELAGTGMTNRANWDRIFDFFFEKMDAFERFF
ncbi:MAG: DUF4268 domain-containing protein [Flavobacterium sp.]|nr:MAG: DUF4268 domain-containing protein [Flavobacterium sp.]